jgi:hypothetical protein
MDVVVKCVLGVSIILNTAASDSIKEKNFCMFFK